MSSCEKEGKFPLGFESSITTVTSDISIVNGVLTFKSFDAYSNILKSIKDNPLEYEKLRKLLLLHGFEPVEMVYSNLDEKIIDPILKSRIIPDHLKPYLKLEPLGNDQFELVETVQGRWLNLILNKDLNFAIGKGLLTVNGDHIIFIDNYTSPTATESKHRINEGSRLKTANISNDTDYEHGGRNYRIKINLRTPDRVYLPTWGFNVFLGLTEIELRHQRRTLGIWWQFDTNSLEILTNSNGWGPNPQNPSGPYGWFDYQNSTGGISNTSQIFQIGNDFRWVFSIGKTIGVNGQYYEVSVGSGA